MAGNGWQWPARCGNEWFFGSFGPDTGDSYGDGASLGLGSPVTASTTLDDDGNAQFYFAGASCAAGSSDVIANVEAGTHQTYPATFSVLAPQPTI